MGVRAPCCDKVNVKKGLWTAEEDAKLLSYVSAHGTGNWTNVPKKAGLKRCGKSCRLRWTNYLRPNLKHEGFTPQEEELIVTLHATIGSRWSIIANQLPGRTDNDVKNYWNTKLSKKLALNGIDPITHRPISEIKNSITTLHLFSAVRRHLPPPIPPPVRRNAIAVHAPAPEELEWVQFLAEDAFDSLEEQDTYRAPPFVAVDDDFDGGDCSSSFVEEILDRDREILEGFSGLVGGNYSL